MNIFISIIYLVLYYEFIIILFYIILEVCISCWLIKLIPISLILKINDQLLCLVQFEDVIYIVDLQRYIYTVILPAHV